MSEQERDWKETKLIEYATLEQEIAIITHEMDTDADLNKLMAERNKLNEAISTMQSLYIPQIKAKQETQAGIKSELIEKWDISSKTVKYDAGSVTIRTRKSLIVDKKAELLLRLKEILGGELEAVECIETFNLERVGKYKDADLISDKIAHYDEKKNVAIKITEDK